ncbi:GDSL-type esterase/lipase family protein [Catellatospora sp. NPDC049133]|jgi:lysophospholipase L1-like esterase|uniref:SGNH/GDSL hydrolase family protein n=1 Tax=Catellatospora sp. NPDC049133 TaxID=3155499 RepID=UPI0033C12C3B
MTAPTVLFIGDSITDSGRHDDPDGLGDGYVRRVAEAIGPKARWLNRGITSNSTRDLLARWDTDVLAERPALVSVLVGINDTWRRYHRADPMAAEEFDANYRALLDPLAANGTRLVLVEPFLLPVDAEQRSWRSDLDPKIEVVRALAHDYGAVLVPADTALNAAGDAATVAPDGFHPSEHGTALLAALWLQHAGPAVTALQRP